MAELETPSGKHFFAGKVAIQHVASINQRAQEYFALMFSDGTEERSIGLSRDAAKRLATDLLASLAETPDGKPDQ